MKSDKLKLIAPLEACSCSSIWEIAATRTRKVNSTSYDWRAREAPASCSRLYMFPPRPAIMLAAETVATTTSYTGGNGN